MKFLILVCILTGCASKPDMIVCDDPIHLYWGAGIKWIDDGYPAGHFEHVHVDNVRCLVNDRIKKEINAAAGQVEVRDPAKPVVVGGTE